MTTFMYPPAMSSHDFFGLPSGFEESNSASGFHFESGPGSSMEALDSLQAQGIFPPTFAEPQFSGDSIPTTMAYHSPPRSPQTALDMQAPALSSASESGASIQSTTSSAMASPALPTTMDGWSAFPNALGLSQATSYATTQAFENLELGAMLAAAKDPSCVETPGPRRNSLLAHQIWPPPSTSEPRQESFTSSPESVASPFFQQSSNIFIPPLLESSSYPAILNHPYGSPNLAGNPYPHQFSGAASGSPLISVIEHPPSPALSHLSSSPSQMPLDSRKIRHGSQSPAYRWEPYATFNESRRPSLSSNISRKSNRSDVDDEPNKGLCPIPECGRVFKDLKAHMLTHQNERPEKCPIPTCEYHTKGFARKYDKNRHTLTHYKGTMVCNFCPGSGSSSEKTFNRADVFKRHLTSVHGVEQTPPNSRKKNSVNKKVQSCGSGECSTCGKIFQNPQVFYEHIDDCVLRVVQQIEPSEAINQKHLESVNDDEKVKKSLERHHLPADIDFTIPSYDDDDEDDEDEGNDDDSSNPRSGKGSIKKKESAGQRPTLGGGSSANRISKATGKAAGPRAGLTFSKGGVPFTGVTSNRKRRKNYPGAWGCPADQMNMKKRVMCVFDGPRRLWKDDMMMDRHFEVRVKLPDGKNYVTDLDVQTLTRAEALQGATEEERGPWIPDNMLEPSGEHSQFFM